MKDGKIKISEIPEVKIATIWLKNFGARIEKGQILIDDSEKVSEKIKELEVALKDPSKAPEDVLEILMKRKLLVKRETVERFVRITKKGREALAAKGDRHVVTRLNKEMVTPSDRNSD